LFMTNFENSSENAPKKEAGPYGPASCHFVFFTASSGITL